MDIEKVRAIKQSLLAETATIDLRASMPSEIRVAVQYVTATRDKQAGEVVDRYFKEVKDGNPSYSDSQAWATAWSIYCAHKNPSSPSCHQDSYFPGKQASSAKQLEQKTKEILDWMEEHKKRGDKSLLIELLSQLRAGRPGAVQGAKEILESAIEAYDIPIKLASEPRTAGFGVTRKPMSILLVQRADKQNADFNRDMMDEINRTTIPIIGDDGEEHDVELKYEGAKWTPGLNPADKKQGIVREIRVDLQVPVDKDGNPDSSKRTALTALAKLGKKHGFNVEPVEKSYTPEHRKLAKDTEAPKGELDDDQEEWLPGQKKGEWNLILSKYSASRWNYFLKNPSGGGSGSGAYPTSKAAFAAGTRVAWGEPSVNPGKKRVWVIEQAWDFETEEYKVKSSKWWDIPADLLNKKFNT